VAKKKQTESVQDEPSPHEIRIAEAIIERSKIYTGDFMTKFSRAARDYNYEDYGALPSGAKTYISRIANKVKVRKQLKKEKESTEASKKELAGFLKENLPARRGELRRTDRTLPAD
jgi:hypothetical protein